MSGDRLLILSFSNLVSDARVLKQITEFTGDYEVTTCGYGPAPEGVVRHLQLPDDARAWRYDKAAVVLRRFRRAYWTNPAVAAAWSMLEGSRFDIVLADDVDTVPIALRLAPARGVHADLHEYAPKQKEDVLVWRLFLGPLMTWLVRRFATRADSVTTVGQGIADEYRRVFGIDAGVVTNAAPFVDARPGPVGDRIRLVHSGAGLRDRNIMTLVDAVEAAKTPVTLDLYLTENDPSLIEELRRRQSDRVTLHPPVPYAQLSSTLNAYDVGIHALPPTSFNNRWALPNKLFDYVQARLGVLIGPSPEMANVVERYAIGTVASGFGVEELAAAIDRMDASSVGRWKAASDAAARELSSASQVAGWRRAIDALAGRDRSA
ncbi:glycosyltransferase [Agromyces sp. M3QZ16-3]|uniref:glycosyltransferase n=1 Tax=Agromyces sp. M3QZ16-3 TaxID=3447585 RepID=UPI003F68C1B2